LASRAFSS
jgi:hypothetical protein